MLRQQAIPLQQRKQYSTGTSAGFRGSKSPSSLVVSSYYLLARNIKVIEATTIEGVHTQTTCRTPCAFDVKEINDKPKTKPAALKKHLLYVHTKNTTAR